MSKTILLSLLSLLFSHPILSQSYQPVWGPVLEGQGYWFNETTSLLGINGDHYYALVHPKGKNKLLKYDMNHELVESIDLNMKYNKKDILYKSIIETKSGTFGYWNYADRKKKEWKIFASTFKEGVFSDPKEIYTHAYNKKAEPITLMRKSEFLNQDDRPLSVSIDSTRIVYENKLPIDDEVKSLQANYAVFDENLDLVWSKVQDFDKYGFFTFVNTTISNTGVVHVLAKKDIKSLRKKDKSLPKYQFILFRITKDDIEDFVIELKDGLTPEKMTMRISDESDNIINFIGFYDKENSGTNQGIFYITKDISAGTQTIKVHQFEASFLKDLVKDKHIKKGYGLGQSHTLDQLVYFHDGSTGLVSSSIRQIDSPNSSSSSFLCKNFIVARFSPEGELIYLQKIFRNLTSRSRHTIRHAVAAVNGKIYLLFNRLKNKEEKGSKGVNHANFVVIDNNGEIAFNQVLFTNKDLKLFFFPNEYDSSSSKLLIIGAKKSKHRFGLIDLN